MSHEISYIKGDATSPLAEGNRIIVHVCNDMGGWGKGFVMAITKKWPEPEMEYRAWYKSQQNFSLGEVQFIKVQENIYVGNMIGQHKIYKDENGNAPIRYEAIELCLEKVAHFAKEIKATVHMPRIGCGLAGGTWDKIEPIIVRTLTEKQIPVFVYDF